MEVKYCRSRISVTWSAGVDQLLAPPRLGGLVGRAEGDVVHGAAGLQAPRPPVAAATSTTAPARRRPSRTARGPRPRPARRMPSRPASISRGRLEQPLGQRHRVQAAHGVLGGHPGDAVPARPGVAGRGDEVDDQAVGVAQRQHLLAVAGRRGRVARRRRGSASRRCHQPIDSGGTLNAVAVVSPAPWRPAGTPVPREERQERRRPPGLVAVVEVVGAGASKLTVCLTSRSPSTAGVEVDVALRVRRDRRDVVQAVRGDVGHPRSPVIPVTVVAGATDARGCSPLYSLVHLMARGDVAEFAP